MKINSKFWIVVIAISLLIIFFKFEFLFLGERKYIFERNIIPKTMFSRTDRKEIVNTEGLVKLTNELICFYSELKQNATRVTYYDLNTFQKVKQFDFSDTDFSQVLYFNKESLFFTKNFILHHYNIQNKTTERIPIKDFKVINIISLNNNSTQLLLFGEKKVSDLEFKTGFYIFDVITRQMKLSKVINTNRESKAIENLLMYSGRFNKEDNIVNYFCDKYSEIYFFDKDGQFQKTIQTKDKTPKGKIINNEHGYYYDRGETYSVNLEVSVFGDHVFVFSCRTKRDEHKAIMIDVYSLSTKEYLYSHRLFYNHKTSFDVNFVSKNKNGMVINFDDDVVEFKMRKRLQ